MTTILAYTNLEQSKKLAEILPLESADMWYHPDLSDYPDYVERCSIYNIHCWSLAALLGVLNCPELTQTSDGGWFIRTWYINHPYNISGVNAIDVCYKMILKLHELKML
jgi:hypothetical protein